MVFGGPHDWQNPLLPHLVLLLPTRKGAPAWSPTPRSPHARIHLYANESPEQHRKRTAELRRNDPRVVKLKADMTDLHQRAATVQAAEPDRSNRLRGQLVQAQVRAAMAAAGIDPSRSGRH